LEGDEVTDWTRNYDVLVIGGGNAGLCAAITAARGGAKVLIVESAPIDYRAGNSRHTRNFRCMHTAPNSVLTDSYPEDEYYEDLLRVTGGETNEQLARMTIRASEGCFQWMVDNGARFQPALGGTLQLSRTNAFFLGGGKALVNAYYRTAESLGIDIVYEAEVTAIDIDEATFRQATVRHKGQDHKIGARAVVFSAGGFEANIDWLEEAWGPPARNFLIRGTPYNKGTCLRMLIDQGAKPIGDPMQCHAVAIDARAPKFDGGICTRVDCVSLGIVVNRNAKRFYDEGEDFWPKRYAIWGRLVAGQPEQVGFSIIDSKAVGNFMPPVFPPIRAGSIAELAAKLELDAATLEATIAEYNAAVQPGTFDITIHDNCRTEGLTPPKSHWARTIDKPPFYSYPLRPGITFTYLGVTVNEKARIIMADGKPATNMLCAGEMMAGNVLGKGYLAGIGMTIGTVFGRIAGKEALHNVRN
jgi:tricarballylate dehydrogenase